MEFTLLKVDRDYRVIIPVAALRSAGWVVVEDAIQGWLLLGESGRLKLITPERAQVDSEFQSLRRYVEEQAGRPIESAIYFRDPSLAILGLRLIPIEITASGPGRRLKLPRVVAAAFDIAPGVSSVALIADQEIEIWNLETFRSSIAAPFPELN